MEVVGKGSLEHLGTTKDGVDRWRLTVSLGRDYINGGHKRARCVFRGSKREAERALRLFINELESGLRADKKKLVFADFATTWLEERRQSGNYTLNTIKKNEYMLRVLMPYLGDVRLSDIDSMAISSLFVKLRNDREGGRPLSGTTAHDVYVMLNHIMKDAMHHRLIASNPCEVVKAPKMDTEEKEALSRDEARRMIGLLTEGEPDANRTGALLALCAGLRREEVCGLRWKDFDPEAGCVRVAQAVTEHDKAPKPPKSKASVRAIPLDPDTAKHLSKWKERQRVELQDIGVGQVDSTPVVSNGVGEYMIPSNLSRWFRGFVTQNSFGKCGLHKLRHTFGTLLVASGIDLVTVAHLMGHSDTAMVSKVYAHVVPDNVMQATKALGGVLYGNAVATAVVMPFSSLNMSA